MGRIRRRDRQWAGKEMPPGELCIQGHIEMICVVQALWGSCWINIQRSMHCYLVWQKLIWVGIVHVCEPVKGTHRT